MEASTSVGASQGGQPTTPKPDDAAASLAAKRHAAIQEASYYNVKLLMDRHRYGPVYFDPNTKSFQVFYSYGINNVSDPTLPKNYTPLGGEELVKPTQTIEQYTQEQLKEAQFARRSTYVGQWHEQFMSQWRTGKAYNARESSSAASRAGAPPTHAAATPSLPKKRKTPEPGNSSEGLSAPTTPGAVDATSVPPKPKRAKNEETEEPAAQVPDKPDECVLCDNSNPSDPTITCTKCNSPHHASCLKVSPSTLQKMRTYKWLCNNCKTCESCGAVGDESKMMMCDSCDRAYHYDCLKPPLNGIPIGDWVCVICKPPAPVQAPAAPVQPPAAPVQPPTPVATPPTPTSTPPTPRTGGLVVSISLKPKQPPPPPQPPVQQQQPQPQAQPQQPPQTQQQPQPQPVVRLVQQPHVAQPSQQTPELQQPQQPVQQPTPTPTPMATTVTTTTPTGAKTSLSSHDAAAAMLGMFNGL